MKKVIVFIGLFLFIISCTSQDKKSRDISVEGLHKTLATNTIQLLDVRTPEEWQQGTIKGAIKVNFYNSDFEEQAIKKLNKDQPVYIYCKSGGRSKKASELLTKKGFKTYNLLGGYTEWKLKNH